MVPTDDRSPDRDAPRQPREIDRRRAFEDDRRRMLQNIAAFVFVVLLLAVGAWLTDRLSAYNRNLLCIQSNQRNCR